MSVLGVFTSRLRGVRILDLVAGLLLLVLAVGSYAFKTLAEAQGADAADVQGQIAQEERRIRLLRAEISHLEAPGRIERLSTAYLSLGAVDPRRDISAEDLPRIARESEAPQPPKAAP